MARLWQLRLFDISLGTGGINIGVAGGDFSAFYRCVGMNFDVRGNMSQAFVKESDDQWLHDLPPTLNALTVYLSRENNGISVYQKNAIADKNGRMVYAMSNGLSYALDKESKWEIVW